MKANTCINESENKEAYLKLDKNSPTENRYELEKRFKRSNRKISKNAINAYTGLLKKSKHIKTKAYS
jgi:hypothetical protein